MLEEKILTTQQVTFLIRNDHISYHQKIVVVYMLCKYMSFEGSYPFIPSCLLIMEKDDDWQLQYHLMDLLENEGYCFEVI